MSMSLLDDNKPISQPQKKTLRSMTLPLMDQEMVGGGLPLALHVMVASSSSAASVSLGASSHDGLATKGQGENNESSNRLVWFGLIHYSAFSAAKAM